MRYKVAGDMIVDFVVYIDAESVEEAEDEAMTILANFDKSFEVGAGSVSLDGAQYIDIHQFEEKED